MSNLLAAILGSFVTWVVAYYYYKRATKDQQLVYKKLSSKVRKAILDDSRNKLSVIELNKLLEEKTIDPETEDPLPFIKCPRCGSKDLKRSSAERPNDGELFLIIECSNQKCNWSEWTQ